jgi:hypothetical protein
MLMLVLVIDEVGSDATGNNEILMTNDETNPNDEYASGKTSGGSASPQDDAKITG